MDALDSLVALAVVAAMVGVGWYAGRGEKSADGFFLGGRHVPAWAACLSFVAAEVSAMTIIGVPADSYRSNWNYAQFFIGSALARIVVAFLFIPAFYETKCTSIYEFLRVRFGPSTQYTATSFFFAMRLLASGVRLYIASLAVSEILQVPLLWSIAAFTILPILFIGWGGMRAVIWTGVMQAIVFIGAGWLVLGYIHTTLDGGLWGALSSVFPVGEAAAARAEATTIPAAKAVFSAAAESGSRVPYFFNLVWDTGGREGLAGTLYAIFASPLALWVGVLVGLFGSVGSFGTDQENVQRLLCVETRRSSQRLLLWTILAGAAVLLTYLAIGSGIAAWFAAHPAAPLAASTDKVFPHFIGTVLPAGLKGLMLGAIILASIDSPLVSLATSAVSDLYKPLVRSDAPDAHYLALSRRLIAEFGVLLGLLAVFFSQFDGILWIALKISGVTLGPMLGVFLYGLMFPRAKSNPVPAMIVSAICGAVLLYLSHTGRIWLAWGWIGIFGTAWTMALMRIFAVGERVACIYTAAEPHPSAAVSGVIS